MKYEWLLTKLFFLENFVYDEWDNISSQSKYFLDYYIFDRQLESVNKDALLIKDIKNPCYYCEKI